MDYTKQELALHAKLKEARTPQNITTIKNTIKTLDSQIDTIIHKIHDLRDEETEMA